MISELLSRLDAVKQTGSHRWIARCPSHPDRRPSLSLRELEDGRVLVHCFAACAVQDVLSAVELDLDALFPAQPIAGRKRERQPFYSSDVLRCVAYECLIIAVAAQDIRRGIALTEADYERLVLASGRVRQAVELACGD
jgi:hypothetical protein